MNEKRKYNLGDKVKLNGQEVIIDDCLFKAWTGYHYKIIGDDNWYQQGCFSL